MSRTPIVAVVWTTIVGAGACSLAWSLAFAPSLSKRGDESGAVFSDQRLKQTIEPLAPGSLDRLLSMRGYTFEYRADAIENGLGQPGGQTGFIAQEVVTAFPLWVDTDEAGFLHVTERGATAIIVEALRELRAEKNKDVATLGGKIGSVRSDVVTVQGDVSALQAELGALREEMKTLREEVVTLREEMETLRAEVATQPDSGTAPAQPD